MLNDLFFLVLGFELTLYLLMLLTLSRIQVEHRKRSALLFFKSTLPPTMVLFSGVALLSAATGSTQLASIQNALQRLSQESGQLLSRSLPALGIILIVTGIAFRMGAISTNFRSREILKEVPYWTSILSVLVTVCAGSTFLVLFVTQIAVIYFAYTEQVLYFIALIVLTASAGLLLIEKELKTTLVLIVMQTTGVFFAQLSAVCWKWRHASVEREAVSIQDLMYGFFPEILFSFLAILGLACLLDCLGSEKSEVRYQNQIQGLIIDQRLLGIAAVFLLAILMGFPGFSEFRMRLQTLRSLFEIHQEVSTGMMTTVHLGYLGLAVLLLISSTIVALSCAKLIIQICVTKPLTRYRQIKHKKMAFICYCWVVCLLIYNLKMITSL